MTSTSKISLVPGGKVLVAGGRGFVGSHLVRALIADGFDTHVLGPAMETDLLADLQGRFGSIACGIDDAAAVREALLTLRPAAVVVCAAHGAGGEGLIQASEAAADKAFAVNVDGLRHMIAAAREAGAAQLIWTSSTTVYGEATGYGAGRVDERAPKRPATLYGLTKHMAEEIGSFAMRRDGYPVVALRLPLVLGPGLWYRGAAASLISLIRAARTGARHQIAFHDEPIDLMHVRDAVAAVLAVLRHAGEVASIYNVNGFTSRSSEIVAALLAQVPGFEVEFSRQPAQRMFPLVDDARLRREIGFVPAAGLRDVILETIAAEAVADRRIET